MLKRWILGILGLTLVFPLLGQVGQAQVGPDNRSVVDGNTSFAVDLYHKAREDGKNLFFSPYSITAAVGMTQLGAREATANEIAKAMHFTLPAEKLHPALASWRESLITKKPGTPYQLEVVNSLWGQKDYSFLKSYLDSTRNYYASEVRAVDFVKDAEAVRQEINAWVAKQTNDKIKELFPANSLDGDTRLALVNAIYFLGNWEKQFNPKTTFPAPFSVTAKTTIDVPMMSMDSAFRMISDKEIQAVELPYKGEALSMVLIVPKKKQGLGGVEQGLSATKIQGWLAALKAKNPSRTMVALPRFKIESSLDLKPLLKSLGVYKAFSPGQANFSGIDGTKKLFIQTAVHKAFVDVNETGTEAAAATGIGIGLTSAPPQVRADHPFLFLIQDRRTGAVLFLGRYVSPKG